MNFGKRLQILRDHLGLTQRDFARRLGITRGYIGTLESFPDKEPSDALLKLISHEFGISYAWLKCGEGEMLLSPEESIKNDLARYGEQAYKNAYHKVFNSSPSSQLKMESREGYQLDPDLEKMIELLKLIWASGDEDLKAWAKVQFRRAFPEDIMKDLQISGNKNKDRYNYLHLSLGSFK